MANEIKLIDGIHHGSHFDAFCGYAEHVLKLIDKALSSGEVKRVSFKKRLRFLRSKTMELDIYTLKLSEGVKLVVITKKDSMDPITAFPVIEGEIVKGKIEKILEWREYPEANISFTCESGANVNFFATDYAMKKNEYLNLNKASVSLSFISYRGSVGFTGEEHKVGEVQGTPVVFNWDEAEILFPASISVEGAFIDDYILTGKVEDFKEIEGAFGEGYLIRVKTEPIGKLKVFVLRSNLEGELEKGAPIRLVGWLQGKLP
ncbi:hypothetical protein PNA2_1834 [Pyrococcus sp. NA2]|uniref:hypothetical protein n=1 Tax=Pyrococcus sp. (strain NA2) TaxID=342949 RepID=UPI000209AC6D|nr:hypothetical protein [Pyrococcus sp. NA2]AEC52749.1 hypothetical protein PNA2_1834 [Pyrococcus sp. NA2]